MFLHFAVLSTEAKGSGGCGRCNGRPPILAPQLSRPRRPMTDLERQMIDSPQNNRTRRQGLGNVAFLWVSCSIFAFWVITAEGREETGGEGHGPLGRMISWCRGPGPRTKPCDRNRSARFGSVVRTQVSTPGWSQGRAWAVLSTNPMFA
jgi:hypothetical protein